MDFTQLSHEEFRCKWFHGAQSLMRNW